MKKKIIIGTLSLVAIATGLFIAACSKINSSPSESTNSSTPLVSNESAETQRNGRKVTFYSKDIVTGQNYKLQIKTNDDGSVEIDRKTTGNHNGQDIINFNFIESGIEYNQSVEDRITVQPPSEKTYFYIPFDPSAPTFRMNGGSGASVTIRCVCGLPSTSSGCRVSGSSGPGGTTFDCVNTICTDCSMTGSAPGPTARVTAGFVIIEATDLAE